MTPQVPQIIRDIFDAVVQGDMHKLATCFSPDAVIWHNVDETEKTIQDASLVLRRLYQLSDWIAYRDQTITRAGNVFFVKHMLNARLKSGAELRLHAIMRFEIGDDGLIARMDEYFDSRATDPLLLPEVEHVFE